MKIAVFGIGYVGAVVAGCVSKALDVVAVDVNRAKVDAINAGQSPLSEPGLEEVIQSGRRSGRLRATLDAQDAFDTSDVFFVCVGTPGQSSGRQDLSFIVGMAEQFGHMLAKAKQGARRTFIYRSTLLPGTMDEVVIPIMERVSGLKAGRDFGVGYMPEFLREGQGIDDFERPAVTVVGSADEASLAVLRILNASNGNDGHGSQFFACDFRTAEAIKFANNAWHAIKISFANEVGSICKASGVDGRRVMDILCADTKLNVSRAYLRPGFAFGGSCLPKDVKALVHYGAQRDVRSTLLESLMASNDAHVGRAVEIIAGCGSRRVLLLGLTFKPDTDDLRDSPFVELAERLIGKGYDLRVFDPSFSYASLTGQNRKFIQTALPHVASLVVPSLEAGLEHGETVVVGHKSPAFAKLTHLAGNRHKIVDLAGVTDLADLPQYQGICW